MGDIHLLFDQFPGVYYLALFLVGACAGSFINVVAHRLPPLLISQWKNQCSELLDEHNIKREDNADSAMVTLTRPRSRCPECLEPLRFYHNIPVFGYFLLAGKCAFCKKKISVRYPAVEGFTAVISIFLGVIYGPGHMLIFSLIFTYTVISLSLIDIDHQLLPDGIVLPLLWSGLLLNCFEWLTDLKSAVFGAVTGYLILWTIYQIHHRLTGKEGMGYGDFKFLAAIGAWFGWQALPMVVLIASLGGTIMALLVAVKTKKGKDAPISFGPYLALSSWVVMVWGDRLWQNYLQIYNL